jgi:hypothetical protein
VNDYIPLISLVLSLVTGPVVLAAMVAIHKNQTRTIIAEETPAIHIAQETRTGVLIKSAMDEERERAKELFALKHEVSEIKGQVSEIKLYVVQLVETTRSQDAKLSRIQELLGELHRSR